MTEPESWSTARPSNAQRLSGQELRSAALAYIESVLARFERTGREPDPWEGIYLARAIGGAFVGLWLTAIEQVDLAIIDPKNRRGFEAPMPQGENVVTLRMLRGALDDLKQLPGRAS